MTKFEEYLWLEQCIKEFEELGMHSSLDAVLDRMDGIWDGLTDAEKLVLNQRSAQKLMEDLGLNTRTEVN